MNTRRPMVQIALDVLATDPSLRPELPADRERAAAVRKTFEHRATQTALA